MLKMNEEKIKEAFRKVKEDIEARDLQIISLKQEIQDLHNRIKNIKQDNSVIEIKKTDENFQNELLEMKKEISKLKERIEDVEQVFLLKTKH